MEINEKICGILTEYANKLKECELPEFLDTINKLPREINVTVGTNIIDGEALMVHNIIMNLTKYNPSTKGCDEKSLEWIIKEYHDNYFDYEKIKNDIIECMK